jgi:hypothetical protein
VYQGSLSIKTSFEYNSIPSSDLFLFSRPNPVMTRPAAGRTGGNGNQTEASKIKETILNWCIEKTKEYPVSFIFNKKT